MKTKTKKPPKQAIVPAVLVEPKPLQLDLGAGNNPRDGFTSVDLYSPNPDVRLDLKKFPWPWADNSVDAIHCSHFVEHLEQEIRYRFFEECWRIMKPDTIMQIFVPSWKSERALGDMDHKFPPVTAFFFFYLNQAWREANKLTYGPYALKCNFEHQAGPMGIAADVATRAHEVQIMLCQRQLETYSDMWCNLVKKPMA